MAGPIIDRVSGRAFRIPTDAPEADGTLSWDATTLVVAEVSAGGARRSRLCLCGHCRGAPDRRRPGWLADRRGRVRDPETAGTRCMARSAISAARGIAANAISAVDVALWDLKAQCLDQPLVEVLGASARRGTDLRQRRLHVVFAGASDRAACGLGRERRLPLGEDENRLEPGAGRVAGARSHAGRSAHAGLVRRRQRRLRPQAGARIRRAVLRIRASAGSRSRCSSDDLAGLAPCARPGAGADRNRGGRIRLRRRGTSAACWKREPSMSCRPTRRAAAASPAFCSAAALCRRLHDSAFGSYGAGAAPACLPARRRGCGTSSGSTITCASSTCCSTARRYRKPE